MLYAGAMSRNTKTEKYLKDLSSLRAWKKTDHYSLKCEWEVEDAEVPSNLFFW